MSINCSSPKFLTLKKMNDMKFLILSKRLIFGIPPLESRVTAFYENTP